MSICPNCGAQLVRKQEESSVVISCVKCDYSVVTTSISLIYEDDNVYSIILEEGNIVNKDTISLLMNITGLNMLEVSKIIKDSCPYELMKGKAVDIKEIAAKLKEKGIVYKITPEFIW